MNTNFFLGHLIKEIIKRYFDDIFGEFLLCLKIYRNGLRCASSNLKQSF